MALLGQGGTGKSTVLLLIEALIEYYAGPETVRKCAISNTAARLIGGDTLHAVCKLPREDLQSRAGKLSLAVLSKLRQKWKNSWAFFIDEISMVAPEQLIQSDLRTRDASWDYLTPPPFSTSGCAWGGRCHVEVWFFKDRRAKKSAAG